MTWIVVVGLFLLAFVPLMYAIPSPRQRRQARLRKQAMMDGLSVEVMYVPKLSAGASEMVNAGGELLDPKIECAAYQIVLSKRLDFPHLLLLKTFEEDQTSIYEVFIGWGVKNESEFRFLKSHPDLIELIMASTNQFPEDVLAFEFAPTKIGILWREDDDSEEVYQSVLGVLRKVKKHFEDSENTCDLR